MVIRTATPVDVGFIVAQQRAESNALGFIPRSRLEWECARGRILVACAGRMRLGYTYLGTSDSHILRIYQCVTERGVRRREIGAAFVARARARALEAGCRWILCRCRLDLEACAFWEAVGFDHTASRAGGMGRGQVLRTYAMPVPVTVGKKSGNLII